MPVFKAIVEGQNFPFIVDGEPHLAGFHKTLYLEADNDNSAADHAITWVKNELASKDIIIEEHSGAPFLEVDELEEVSAAEYKPEIDEEYIWYLADTSSDDLDDEE